MIVSKQFIAVCRGCNKQFSLYEYKGLKGGLYSNHYCFEMGQLFIDHPRIRKTFEKLRQVSKGDF